MKALSRLKKREKDDGISFWRRTKPAQGEEEMAASVSAYDVPLPESDDSTVDSHVSERHERSARGLSLDSVVRPKYDLEPHNVPLPYEMTSDDSTFEPHETYTFEPPPRRPFSGFTFGSLAGQTPLKFTFGGGGGRREEEEGKGGRSQDPPARWRFLSDDALPVEAPVYAVLPAGKGADLVYELLQRDELPAFLRMLDASMVVHRRRRVLDTETNESFEVLQLEPESGWAFNRLFSELTQARRWRKKRTLEPGLGEFLATSVPPFRCVEQGCAPGDLVKGTTIPVALVERHADLASQALEYIAKVGGIKSRVAAFFIIRAALSAKFGHIVTIERGTAMWQGYCREIQRADAETRQVESKEVQDDPVLSHALFAIKALMILKFPNSELVSVCPYREPGQNFITGLFTHECVCNCYAGYLAAAAEEVGRQEWIVPIMFLGHANVAVLDRMHPIPAARVAGTVARAYDALLTQRNMPSWPWAFEHLLPRGQVFKPAIMIEAGFPSNQRYFRLLVEREEQAKLASVLMHFCRCDVSLYPAGFKDTFSRGNVWSVFEYCLGPLIAGRGGGAPLMTEDRMLFEITCLG